MSNTMLILFNFSEFPTNLAYQRLHSVADRWLWKCQTQTSQYQSSSVSLVAAILLLVNTNVSSQKCQYIIYSRQISSHAGCPSHSWSGQTWEHHILRRYWNNLK